MMVQWFSLDDWWLFRFGLIMQIQIIQLDQLNWKEARLWSLRSVFQIMKLVDLVSLTLAERRKEGRPQTISADCSIATDGQCVVISGQQVSVTCPIEGGAQEKVYKLEKKKWKLVNGSDFYANKMKIGRNKYNYFKTILEQQRVIRRLLRKKPTFNSLPDQETSLDKVSYRRRRRRSQKARQRSLLLFGRRIIVRTWMPH